MTVVVRRRTKRGGRLLQGLLCIVLGLYPLSIALGFLDVGDTRAHAPMWIIALSGTVFLIAGFMILSASQSYVNDLLAAVVCLSFGSVGLWVAFFGPSESFSGGIPFLSRDTSVQIARWVFGCGASICLVISGWAFCRAFRSRN